METAYIIENSIVDFLEVEGTVKVYRGGAGDGRDREARRTQIDSGRDPGSISDR